MFLCYPRILFLREISNNKNDNKQLNEIVSRLGNAVTTCCFQFVVSLNSDSRYPEKIGYNYEARRYLQPNKKWSSLPLRLSKLFYGVFSLDVRKEAERG